jgi:hypothetical protein
MREEGDSSLFSCSFLSLSISYPFSPFLPLRSLVRRRRLQYQLVGFQPG